MILTLVVVWLACSVLLALLVAKCIDTCDSSASARREDRPANDPPARRRAGRGRRVVGLPG